MRLHSYYYCLSYPNGDLVALDKDSGGYPYAAYTPAQVQYWEPDEAHKAIEYAKIVSSFGPFRLVKVKLVKESAI